MTANLKLIDFPNNNLRDIPKMLRSAADRIETGILGEVSHAALILKNEDGIIVHGFGDEANSLETHYMLACAQRQLEL